MRVAARGGVGAVLLGGAQALLMPRSPCDQESGSFLFWRHLQPRLKRDPEHSVRDPWCPTCISAEAAGWDAGASQPVSSHLVTLSLCLHSLFPGAG